MGKRPNNTPTGVKYEVIPTTLQMFDKLRRMPPCRKSDPDMISQRLDEYFRLCGEYSVQPTVEGLTVALGVSRESLWKWQQDKGSESGRLIDGAKNIINAMLTDATINGQVNCVFSIWLQKNHFSYKDNQTLEVVQRSEEETALSEQVENAGLIWSDELQDFVIDRERGSE
jgi:hypothetical protein